MICIPSWKTSSGAAAMNRVGVDIFGGRNFVFNAGVPVPALAPKPAGPKVDPALKPKSLGMTETCAAYIASGPRDFVMDEADPGAFGFPGAPLTASIRERWPPALPPVTPILFGSMP